MSTTENIQTAANNFGSIIYWSVAQDAVIKVEEAKTVAEMHGFEGADFKAASLEAEVSRAVHSFRDRHSKEDRKVAEPIKNTATEKVWGILSHNRVGEEEVAFTQDTKVTFHKVTKTVSAEGSQANEFFARYEQFKDSIIDEDIRNFIQNVRLLARGINLREGSGGIYFVPQRFVWLIESAQKVLDDLKVDAKIYMLPMQNTESARQDIWESVEREINNDVEMLVKQAENVTRNISSFKKKEDKLKELDGLMQIYRDLLGAEAQYEELAERLGDASGKVASLMTDLQSSKAVKVAKETKSRKADPATSKPIVANAGTDVNPWIAAATAVLANAGVPMHYKAITEKAIADGLVESNGKTPWNTLTTAINRYNEGELVSLGKGMYELANA
jgi:hypothetical protein